MDMRIASVTRLQPNCSAAAPIERVAILLGHQRVNYFVTLTKASSVPETFVETKGTWQVHTKTETIN
jgi:hypothetical protein